VASTGSLDNQGTGVSPAQTVNPTKDGGSYRQILKSATLVGGSSVINILLGIIRTKAMALLLGPVGVGLIGTYYSITEMVRAVASMGINDSGVRQISQAVATADELRVARTVITLRRVALVLGAAGALALLLFSGPICRMTFGNTDRIWPLAILSVTILFAAVSGGQATLIQGMRRIGDLAKMTVLGGLYGTVFSIPIVYFLGERGIVPFLVSVSAMSMLTSWWYARGIRIAGVRIRWAETWTEASALLRLGFVFLASGVMSAAVAYLVRAILMHRVGLEAVGLYQAASTLSGLYIDFILTAMGRDFYPRLTAAAQDDAACNRLVNEQTEVGLLLAAPGILATLSFTPLVLGMFYTSKFGPAAEVLRWMALGLLLRVASWPMLILLPARGESKWFFAIQFAANVVHLSLIYFGISYWGLVGTGMATVGLYLFYCCATFMILRRLSGFALSAANMRLGALILSTTLLVFLLFSTSNVQKAVWIGGFLTFAIGIYSLRKLYVLGGKELVSSFWQKLLTASSGAH